jgi:hypothetical protein
MTTTKIRHYIAFYDMREPAPVDPYWRMELPSDVALAIAQRTDEMLGRPPRSAEDFDQLLVRITSR